MAVKGYEKPSAPEPFLGDCGRFGSEMITESRKSRHFVSTGKSAFQECGQLFKAGGFKAVFRRYGWKALIALFAYYLIRDLTLYLLIPYLIAEHIIL